MGGQGDGCWVKLEALSSVHDYIETGRAEAVRRTKAPKGYVRLRDLGIVGRGGDGGRLGVARSDGMSSSVNVTDLSPQQGALLFTRPGGGLEPLSLWLNEDGLLRPQRSWYKSFASATAREESWGQATGRDPSDRGPGLSRPPGHRLRPPDRARKHQARRFDATAGVRP